MSQPVDAKQYYGYLFEVDKKPTKVLDALLRGIAIYIVSCDQVARHAPAIERTSKLTVAEHLDRKPGAEEAHARQTGHLLQGCRRQLRLFVPINYTSQRSQLTMPCHSSLRRSPSSLHLLDLRINRMPAHTSADQRRLRAPFHPRPHKERLRALAVHRDPAWARRTRPLHPDCGPYIQHQAPRHRGAIPPRPTRLCLPPRRRQGDREMAQCMR